METTIRKIVNLTALSAGLCCLSAQSPTSVWDGVYSLEQARRGEALYKQGCAACHGDNLEGDAKTKRSEKLNRSMPPLSGDVFKGDWNGRPLSDLFDRIRKTMPRDDPGTISAKDDADILAYLLKFNGFPAGKKDLAADAESMTDITFDMVKPK
jgi:cytochrome c